MVAGKIPDRLGKLGNTSRHMNMEEPTREIPSQATHVTDSFVFKKFLESCWLSCANLYLTGGRADWKDRADRVLDLLIYKFCRVSVYVSKRQKDLCRNSEITAKDQETLLRSGTMAEEESDLQINMLKEDLFLITEGMITEADLSPAEFIKSREELILEPAMARALYKTFIVLETRQIFSLFKYASKSTKILLKPLYQIRDERSPYNLPKVADARRKNVSTYLNILICNFFNNPRNMEVINYFYAVFPYLKNNDLLNKIKTLDDYSRFEKNLKELVHCALDVIISGDYDNVGEPFDTERVLHIDREQYKSNYTALCRLADYANLFYTEMLSLSSEKKKKSSNELAPCSLHVDTSKKVKFHYCEICFRPRVSAKYCSLHRAPENKKEYDRQRKLLDDAADRIHTILSLSYSLINRDLIKYILNTPKRNIKVKFLKSKYCSKPCNYNDFELFLVRSLRIPRIYNYDEQNWFNLQDKLRAKLSSREALMKLAKSLSLVLPKDDEKIIFLCMLGLEYKSNSDFNKEVEDYLLLLSKKLHDIMEQNSDNTEITTRSYILNGFDLFLKEICLPCLDDMLPYVPSKFYLLSMEYAVAQNLNLDSAIIGIKNGLLKVKSNYPEVSIPLEELLGDTLSYEEPDKFLKSLLIKMGYTEDDYFEWAKNNPAVVEEILRRYFLCVNLEYMSGHRSSAKLQLRAS